MSRFPFTSFPHSWFQVAWSKDIKKGKIKRLNWFNKDLVMFRGENDSVSITDPYCPHLGAHLAVGGEVSGNCIRCPFHGWEFDQDGSRWMPQP